MSGTEDTDPLGAAADILYAAPPEEFMTRRAELSKQAKAHGETTVAKAISDLRKPTLAASVVNRFVHSQRDAVARLTDVGARLRDAHRDLDAARLRELSTERRALVSEFVGAAFTLVGQDAPSAPVRDEVSSTLDAAVADPEIAARLGRLIKPEHWSGFGVAPATGSPELTLVRGGKDARRTSSSRSASRSAVDRETGSTKTRSAGTQSAGTQSAGTQSAGTQSAGTRSTETESAGTSSRSATRSPATTVSSSDRRRLQRTVTKAQNAFDSTDAALMSAQHEEHATGERVRTLNQQIAELSRQLDETKRELDRTRRETKAARTRRREARSALDRAERQLPD